MVGPAGSNGLLSTTGSPGRRREWTALWDTYAAVEQRGCRVAMLVGEPGIGKTRLLDELARQATHEGAVVLRGGGSEAAGMPPYLPFLQAMGAYARTAPLEDLRMAAGPVASTLATLLPDVAYRLGSPAPDYPLPLDQARLRLYEAIGEFLAALARGGRVVLTLDDLQWADSATLDLFLHLVGRPAAGKLFLAGAYRSNDLAEHAALERLLVELHRRRLLTTIGLGPLDIAGVGALAEEQIGAPLAPDGVTFLHLHSAGNPFFAEELLIEWRDGGALERNNGDWVLHADRAETLPPGIIGAIRVRLARLEPAVVDLLRIAAFIGPTFPQAIAADVAGQDEEAAEGFLARAVHARLIRQEGAGIYTFSHGKIRETLQVEVSLARRQRLHAAIGVALEARPQVAAEGYLETLAFHFTRAGDRARGARYAQLAAEQALRRFAPADAVSAYQEALDLLDAHDAAYGEILLKQGEAAMLADNLPVARRVLTIAQSWFAIVRDAVGMARADRLLALARGDSRAVSATRAEMDEALALLGHDLPAPSRWLRRVYAWRALHDALQGVWDQAERPIVEGLPVVLRLGGGANLILLRHLRGFLAFQRGLYTEAEQDWQAALAGVGDSGLPDLRWRLGLLGLLALSHVETGRVQAARTLLDELAGIVGQRALIGGSATTLLALGWLQLGESARAGTLYSALLALQGEIHWVLVDRVLGILDMERREWHAAAAHLGRAELVAREEGLRPELARTLLDRAHFELKFGGRGSTVRARPLAEEARVLAEGLEMAGLTQEVQALLVRMGPRDAPAGLSSREVMVLRLLVAGLSNRQIAANLGLSEKTVANHLTSIFNKIGVDNRAAATAFALREGIV